MKKVLTLIFCLLLLSSAVFANEISEYELFVSEKGTLVIKDFYKIGKIEKGLEASTDMQVLILTHPQTDKRLKGLRIEVYNYINKIGSRTEVSFLDESESESLSSALSYIIETIKKWAPEQREYAEVIFNVADDFRVGFYQKGVKQEAFVSSGRIT